MNWTWVVAIEGVTLSKTSTRPTGFSTIADPGDSVRPEGAVLGPYAPLLVPGSIRLSEQSINVMSGDPPAQSLSFELILTDALFDVLFAKPQPIGVLGLDVAPTAPAMQVLTPTSNLEGIVGSSLTTLWVGREAFVGTALSDIFTFVDTLPAGLLYPDAGSDNDLTRTVDGADGVLGHLFTRVRQHDYQTGLPPWSDFRVYAQNPILRGRRVFLYRGGFNAAGEYIEQLFGQYVINSEIATGAEQTTVSISAQSLIGTARSSKLNTNPQVYQFDVSLQVSGGGSFAYAETSSGGGSSYNPGAPSYVTVAAGNRDAAFLFRGGFNSSGVLTSAILVASDGEAADLNGNILQRRFGMTNGVPTQDGPVSLNELLVSDPLISVQVQNLPYYDGSNAVLNPITMVLQHLGEHPSNLSDQWILRLGPDAVDVEGLQALAPFYSSVRFDGVVAGHDGKAVGALKWIADTFLRPIGAGWAIDQHGRLTVRTLLLPVVSGTAATQATTLPGRAQRRSLEVAADAIRMTVGQGAGESPIITINGIDAIAPDPLDPQSSVYEIDGRGYLAADTVIGSRDILNTPSVSFARAVVSTLSELLANGPYQVNLAITTSGIQAIDPALIQDLLPGYLLDITLTGFRGFSDVLVSGIVIGHKYSSDLTQHNVRVLLLDVSLRKWSAAAVVTAIGDNGDGTYTPTFETDDTITPLTDGSYAVDGQTFTTDLQTLVHQYGLGGVDLSLCDANLAYRDTITFDGVDTFTSSTALQVGDWIVLGDLGDNPATEAESILAFIDRDRFSI